MININIIKNNKFKKIIKALSFPMIIGIISMLFLSSYILFNVLNQAKLQNKTFRLHVVSNSNTYEDQLIKCIISNELENYLNTNFNISTINNKSELINVLDTNSNTILNFVNSKLQEKNINYYAKLKLGNIHYNDTKENFFYTMEKGNYDSLQIVLGKGNGKNFWNLIFPNEENIDSLKELNTILPGINNIYNKESKINYSSKIIELINSIF